MINLEISQLESEDLSIIINAEIYSALFSIQKGFVIHKFDSIYAIHNKVLLVINQMKNFAKIIKPFLQ